MALDIDFAAKIASPLIVSILGAAFNKYIEAKPRLITYLTHASAVPFNGAGGSQVNTHCVVVANIGKKTANNIRIGHYNLPPAFQIHPPLAYSVSSTPSGNSEIVIPTLVQGEQIFVTYMYSPPLLFSGVNAYTKSDEGSAKVISVFPRPQPPKAVIFALLALMFIGGSSLIYWTIIFVAGLAK